MPWFQLSEITLLPTAMIPHRDTIYELSPDDPNALIKLPTTRPPDPLELPFYHTVIVYGLPCTKDPAQNIHTLREYIRDYQDDLRFDHLWCPDEPGYGGTVFVVCPDAETAQDLLYLLPSIEPFGRDLVGEIYVPTGGGSIERCRSIQEWSNVIMWVELPDNKLELHMGLRSSSDGCKWVFYGDFSYNFSDTDDESNSVTFYFHHGLQDSGGLMEGFFDDPKVEAVASSINSELEERFEGGGDRIGVNFVFRHKDHSDRFRQWLTEACSLGLCLPY